MNIKKLQWVVSNDYVRTDPVYEAIVGDHRYQIFNRSEIDEPSEHSIYLSMVQSNYDGEVEIGEDYYSTLEEAKEAAQKDFDQRMKQYFV
jgi:hypothetical protein